MTSIEQIKSKLRQQMDIALQSNGPHEGMTPVQACQAAIDCMISVAVDVLAEVKAEHENRNRSRYKTEQR